MKLQKIWMIVLLVFCFISVNEIQARSTRGIRSVDFYNFTYNLSDDKVKLKNGRYEEKDDEGVIEWTSKLSFIRYVDFNDDGEEEAVVLIKSRGSGSHHGDNDYFVFAYRQGRPRLILHQNNEGKERFRIKDRALILSGESWNSDNQIPHCCPPFTETLVYRWRGSRMVIAKRFLKNNPRFQNTKSS